MFVRGAWLRFRRAAVVVPVTFAVTTMTAGTALAAPPKTSAPPAAPGTAAVPGLPAIPTTLTGGVPAQSLLSDALALNSADVTSAPLQAQISAVSAQLTADLVTASEAQAAASKALEAETAAEARAAAASREYRSLAGALRAATVRLYMTGAVPLPAAASTNPDTLLYATNYEEAALTPRGVLARRRLDDRQKTSSLARSRADAGVAVAEADRAATAVAAATAQRQLLAAEVSSLSTAAAREVTAEHQAVSAQAGAKLTSATSLQFTPTAPIPAPVATTNVALDWLFSELGHTYAYGGSGPVVFDCSGLTQFVWDKAGVIIPRVAADQDSWTIPVPLSQLMPGDLVFYGTTDIHHVGMYIGNGLMINAPHTGTLVQVSSIWWSDLAGFGRVHAIGVPVPSHLLPSAAAPAPQAVVPTVGAVPAQTAPPIGFAGSGSLPLATVGAPGTGPVIPPTTTTLAPAGGTTPPSTPGPASTTTAPPSTTPSSTTTTSSTTLPASTTTAPPASTTTSSTSTTSTTTVPKK